MVALCAIAAGEMDGFFEVDLKPWDYAAGQILVEEAGGRGSRFDGAELFLFDGQKGVLITNGLIHEQTLGLIRK